MPAESRFSKPAALSNSQRRLVFRTHASADGPPIWKSATPLVGNPASRAAWPGLFACLLLLLAGVGCRSLTEPGSASFASITLKDYSEAEIAAATMEVFEADGYRGRRTGQSQLTFDKEASRGTTLAREGIVNTQSGAQTLNRVVVDIVRLSAAYRVQCKAYMVTGGGDSFFQEEVPVAHIRRGPYQSLLNKVEKHLDSNASTAP